MPLSRPGAYLAALLLSAALSEARPLTKTLCQLGQCISAEYEPCLTRLRLRGPMLPDQLQEISLAQNTSRCFPLDTAQLTQLAQVAGQDASVIQLLEPFEPALCFALSDVHVVQGETATFRATVSVAAQKEQFGFKPPPFPLPGMDQVVRLGTLCSHRNQLECNGLCGWCTTGGCMMGDSNGPLCGTCAGGWHAPTRAPTGPPSPAPTSLPQVAGHKGSDGEDDGDQDEGGHHKGGGGSAGGNGGYIFAVVFLTLLVVGMIGAAAGYFWWKRRRAPAAMDVDTVWGGAGQAYDPAIQEPTVVQGTVVTVETTQLTDDH